MLYQRTIESGEQSLGHDHATVGEYHHNLAVVLDDQVRTRATLEGVVGRGCLKTSLYSTSLVSVSVIMLLLN